MNVSQSLSTKPVLPVLFQIILPKDFGQCFQARVSVVMFSTVNLKRTVDQSCQGGVSITAALAHISSLPPRQCCSTKIMRWCWVMVHYQEVAYLRQKRDFLGARKRLVI